MSKVLLFDFDGTIADSFENFIEIMNVLSVKYRFPMLPREDLELLRSKGARTLIKRLKVPLYKIPFMGRDMKQLQNEKIMHIKPYQGLSEVLHFLKNKGYKLGILSSNSKENIKYFIKHNDIDTFDYIYTDSSIFGKDKVIRKFLKKHALTKEQVMYIGDEIRDIHACQKVGIKIIAVTWGFNAKVGLEQNNPDFLIDKPKELLDVIEKRT